LIKVEDIFERRGREGFAEDAEESKKKNKILNFFSALSAQPSRPLRSKAFFLN
jgi:hypothetical protein